MITAEAYESDYGAESYEQMELTEEAIRGRFRPGRIVSIPGSLSSATLNTPKGPASLTLPAPVPTIPQFRALEQAVNNNTQRLNAVQTALSRIIRDGGTRRVDQQSQVSSMMMFSLLTQRRARDDLAGHTHDAAGNAVLPAGSGGFSSLLPLILLMQPNAFGGGSTQGQDGMMGGFSPMLLALLFLD